MTTIIDEEKPDDFIQYMFDEEPKPKDTIQLECPDIGDGKNTHLHIFEQLLMIYVQGLKHKWHNEDGKVDLTQLTDENISLMKVAASLNFNDFLIMPPAYYKYGDKEVIEFYSRVVDAIPSSKIILYNFEKLCGYKFSIECIKELVKKYPKQIVGVKDSSYNLYENLKIDNFSVLPGSESKLLKGLELGCTGIITATCNVTGSLSRKVYDDFIEKNKQTNNEKLCKVRNIFEKFNLISGLHSFMSAENEIYNNVLPPVSLLSEEDKKNLMKDLNKLNFKLGSLEAT